MMSSTIGHTFAFLPRTMQTSLYFYDVLRSITMYCHVLGDKNPESLTHVSS